MKKVWYISFLAMICLWNILHHHLFLVCRKSSFIFWFSFNKNVTGERERKGERERERRRGREGGRERGEGVFEVTWWISGKFWSYDIWETTRCRQFSRYVINVGDTMCREFVTANAIARDTLPRSSRTTSLRCRTPIRGKLIVTISLSGAHPPSHMGDASSAVPRYAAILPSPS